MDCVVLATSKFQIRLTASCILIEPFSRYHLKQLHSNLTGNIIKSFSQQCSSSCGRGKRSRDVKCYADSEEDATEKSCDPDAKPPTEDVCNLVNCPEGK